MEQICQPNIKKTLITFSNKIFVLFRIENEIVYIYIILMSFKSVYNLLKPCHLKPFF